MVEKFDEEKAIIRSTDDGRTTKKWLKRIREKADRFKAESKTKEDFTIKMCKAFIVSDVEAMLKSYWFK